MLFMKVDVDTRRVIERIKAQTAAVRPDSPEMRRALTSIGILIQREAVINARRQGIIDSGRLINSIRFEFFEEEGKPGILVGSFGVPYAAINEFGGPFTDRQRRAMFAALARTGRLKKNYAPKGVILGNRWKARPYLGPAVNDNKQRILQILREVATK